MSAPTDALSAVEPTDGTRLIEMTVILSFVGQLWGGLEFSGSRA